MSLLVALAQVKMQLEERLVETKAVSRLISCSNDGLDVYGLLAKDLGCPRKDAKELFIATIYKKTSSSRPALVSLFFELYPELLAWYSEDNYYVRYRP